MKNKKKRKKEKPQVPQLFNPRASPQQLFLKN